MEEDDFLFIQETGAPHKAETKSRIKMHVMDRVVNQRRSPKPDRTRVRRLESKDRHRVQTQTHQAHPPGLLSGIEDMIRLAGLPIELSNADTKFILYHFLNTHSPLMCTVASETGWLKYALEDSMLFDSTLYYWAHLNHRRLPVKFLNQESVIRLKGLAISKITPRLGGANRGEVDDALIASVACLANVNFKLGNLDEAKIHFRGLAALIKAGRGIHSLGYEGLIARLLKATDNFHAQLSGTKLLFEELTENAPRIESISNLDFSFSGILTHLRGIAAPLIASPKDAMPLKERVSLGQIFLNSDRKIMKHIDNTTPCISNVVATGALLYSHVILRGMESSYPLVIAAVNQLRLSIIAAYTVRATIFRENPFALVWVLFIGAITAETGSVDSNWFKNSLETACQDDSERILEYLQSMLDNKSLGSPQPFYWMLHDDWIQISSVNTEMF